MSKLGRKCFICSRGSKERPQARRTHPDSPVLRTYSPPRSPSLRPAGPAHEPSPRPRSGTAHAQASRATAYLCKARGGRFFLLTGAVSPGAAAVVGRTGWPLLAVPGYPWSGGGSHNWNLSRHPCPQFSSFPLPTSFSGLALGLPARCYFRLNARKPGLDSQSIR